jgi:hypothetical protein
MGEQLLLGVDGDGSGNASDQQSALLRNRPSPMSRYSSDESVLPDSRSMIYKVGACGVLWYVFSFTTLFLNKYILASLNGDPTVLSKLSSLPRCSTPHSSLDIALFPTTHTQAHSK